ncbi:MULTISPECIES: amidohydrolase [unclassified Leucobacter]|uniref:amidohydrolase n=1 Tax=unclassified Leucobacter TaxID=2621730 RepID=UPI00165D51C6|nr:MULTISPECIES: amidohydrolase [unclassified Leucobacter]MBC9937589.1 amidohydrolase [Leucobacter sp. cx-87]
MTTQEPRGGDLAIVGARLRTNTADHGDATAILAVDGRIRLVGSDAEVREAAETAGIEVRDLAGATVTPGLFDGHTHPVWAAEVTAGVNLGGLETVAEICAALAAEAERVPADRWVRGWNLEYEPFEETGMLASLIEEAVGGRPTALMCYDMHTALVTRAALEAAGVTGAQHFEDASEIVVDADGVPTGELREPSAYQFVLAAAPVLSAEETLEANREMLERLAAVGLTGGAIMDGNAGTIEVLAELEARGQLIQRFTVHHWHTVDTDDAEVARIIAGKDRRGRLWQAGAIKLFSDGVVDTGTAWLHTVDACGDGRAGFWPDWNRYVEVVQDYHDAGMLIATHAVGDYAVSQVLDVYAALPQRDGLPFHSIEHLEVLADSDLEQLKGSGVTASMQPLHMQWRAADGSDNWTVRLGEGRDATGYRARSVLDVGATLVLGSDWPVAQYDPRLGMAWARGRHTPGDPNARVFEPGERLSGEEALLAYTLWPAEARGHLDRGALAPGMVADFTVWAQDPVLTDADALPDLAIVATIVDGKVVFG